MLGTVNILPSFIANLHSFNLESDTLKFMLLTDSFTASDLISTVGDVVAYELSGNGYSRKTLTNPTFSLISEKYYFTFDPVVETASGGSISAKYWVIYDDTLVDDPLICYGYLDELQTIVSCSSGQSLTFTPNAAFGLLSLSNI